MVVPLFHAHALGSHYKKYDILCFFCETRIEPPCQSTE